MRHDSEVCTIGGIHEDSKTGDEAEHGSFVVRVEQTDGEFETAHCDTAEDNPDLLAPD